MGKKGGSKKGKPVVMTQQEFFQSQQAQSSELNYPRVFKDMTKEDQTTSWDKVDIFGQNKGKVILAATLPPPTQDEAKAKTIPPEVEIKNVEPKEEKKK